MKKLTLLFLFLSQISFAQTDIVGKTIDKIDFQQDTILSVFDWITDNIAYDIDKYNQRDKKKTRKEKRKTAKFSSRKERNHNLLQEVIKSKKGVCEEYALLFDTIVKRLGYESHIISGYTKNQKGKISRIGHAWNAIKVKGQWRLYDPTWGSGSIKGGKEFVKRYNPQWYDVDPKTMIENHMPYDPIWQLSNRPISYKDFEKNLSSEYTGPPFDFETLIAEQKNKSRREIIQDQLDRSNTLGKGIKLVEKWKKGLSKNLESFKSKDKIGSLIEANDQINKAVKFFNQYVDEKNKLVSSSKWDIDKAEKFLNQAKSEIQPAIEVFSNTDLKKRKEKNAIKTSLKHSNGLLSQINQELAFIASQRSK